MKIRLVCIAAALFLSLPAMAFAQGEQNNPSHGHKDGQRHHSWMQHHQHHQDQLLGLVKEYSPETLDKWKSAVDERNKLMQQLQDPALQQKFKEEHKKQWDSLSKEEREKLFQQKKAEWEAKRESHKQFMMQLKTAADEKNKQKVAELLTQKYNQFTEKNKMIADKIQKVKGSSTN